MVVAGEREVGALESDERPQLVDGGRGDLGELEARSGPAGDGVQQLGLAPAQLHSLEEVGVVDGEGRRPADRLGGGHRARREAPGAGVEQVDDPDDAVLGDERHEELGLIAVRPQLGDLDGPAARVVERGELHRLATRHRQRDGGPVGQRVRAADPRGDRLAALDARRADELVARDEVDVARRHGGHLAESIGRRLEDVGQLERRREAQARVRHQGEPPAALVELPVEDRVDHGLGGDLGEAVQEPHLGEVAGLAVVEGDQADDVPPGDERQVDARAVSGGQGPGAFLGPEVGVDS